MKKSSIEKTGFDIFVVRKDSLGGPLLAAWLLPILMLAPAGCTVRKDSVGEQHVRRSSLVARRTGHGSRATSHEKATDARVPAYDIPRFATNSPFDTEYDSPVPKEGKRLWAASRLWAKAPDFVVEKWLTDKPDTNGKYLLIEFWATWCRQCRRAVPVINDIHRKFADELVVIGISDEEEQIVRKFRELKIEYHVAIDTRAQMKNDLGVFGIPHCIIIEPDGYVVWEGFPLLKGHELTEEVVEKILEAGKKRQPKSPTRQSRFGDGTPQPAKNGR